MKVLVTMRQALSDVELLGSEFSAPSWASWRVLLIAAAGEKLDRSERKVFTRLTGRPKKFGRMADLVLGIIGRRGGKSKAAAVFMTWLATCCDWTDDLSLGERGIGLIISPTERQSQITRDYICALI